MWTFCWLQDSLEAALSAMAMEEYPEVFGQSPVPCLIFYQIQDIDTSTQGSVSRLRICSRWNQFSTLQNIIFLHLAEAMLSHTWCGPGPK